VLKALIVLPDHLQGVCGHHDSSLVCTPAGQQARKAQHVLTACACRCMHKVKTIGTCGVVQWNTLLTSGLLSGWMVVCLQLIMQQLYCLKALQSSTPRSHTPHSPECCCLGGLLLAPHHA
jgi:hypothetical protein